MVTLPKEFQVGGKTFKVRMIPTLAKCGALGMARYDDCEIWLEASIQNDDMKGITFYHEIVHVILDTMGRNSLRDDEEFVDSFANLLWQIEKTGKHK